MKYIHSFKKAFFLLVLVFLWNAVFVGVFHSDRYKEYFSNRTFKDAKYSFQSELLRFDLDQSPCKVFVLGDFNFVSQFKDFGPSIYYFGVQGLDPAELKSLLKHLRPLEPDHLFLQTGPQILSNLDRDKSSSGVAPDVSAWKAFQGEKSWMGFKGSKNFLESVKIIFEMAGLPKEKKVTRIQSLFPMKPSPLNTHVYKSQLDLFPKVHFVHFIENLPVEEDLAYWKLYKQKIQDPMDTRLLSIESSRHKIQEYVGVCK